MTEPEAPNPPAPAGPVAGVGVAWLVTLGVSTIPDMAWIHYIGSVPPGMIMFKAGLLAGMVVLGLAWKHLRPLGAYFTLLLVNVLGWWAIDRVRALPTVAAWEENAGWVAGIMAIQLMKLALAAVTIVALLLVMRRRQPAGLMCGDLGAPAERVPWLGLMHPTPWKIFGPIVAVTAATMIGLFMWMANRPTAEVLTHTLPLVGTVLFCALLNAFSEEISFRASLVAPLHRTVGKNQAMALTAVFFGLAHYAGGVPLAVFPTLVMTGFLGWLMAKSLIETKGLGWAWFIHAVADIPVFFFLAANAVTAGP
ncbi:MAG TPA: CPBP family intramembrane metalloprotease [Acidobacteriota bacterium]|nr:CPBP family intramembrane metalloprotease [Acidobacteriota bacterium]HQF87539.1 CPBP family intramembrane metalloprotease [Acidobacteriota bacterium]HQG92731.1 CPBP family intramembrane metalloprotease [Acidobacteriota bacterium]